VASFRGARHLGPTVGSCRTGRQHHYLWCECMRTSASPLPCTDRICSIPLVQRSCPNLSPSILLHPPKGRQANGLPLCHSCTAAVECPQCCGDTAARWNHDFCVTAVALLHGCCAIVPQVCHGCGTAAGFLQGFCGIVACTMYQCCSGGGVEFAFRMRGLPLMVRLACRILALSFSSRYPHLFCC
jgi:hypothetical protein